MQELDLYKLFVELLNFNKIPYVVTGSVASIIYGKPGIIYNIDFEIRLKVY